MLLFVLFYCHKVWTHPPRVEKVEPGLTADKCGILAGDFVIFVDKHNVVTMPELDILNLIKSQGNTLLLEIYRRSSTKPSNGLKNRSSVTISSNQMMIEQATPKQSTIALEPRPSTACSNTSYSMETTKRRLHLPQVTFSKEVYRNQLLFRSTFIKMFQHFSQLPHTRWMMYLDDFFTS